MAEASAKEVLMVDLRSDTLTEPSTAMKEAMMQAPLGDDVFCEDPTAIELERKVAALLGKEAALFVPTGTMGNLVCVLSHCQTRAAEILLGDKSHIYIWEQGGVSQLGGVHPRTLKNLPDGTFSLEELRESVRGQDVHLPVTSLVCVENTHNMAGGKVLPLPWLDELGALCGQLGLPLHMDGARLLNAATALQVPPARIVRDCASVTICLSKGLGAPIGSVVAGSCDFIYKARRMRKALGGGMRQVGVLAAAGIYALDHVAPSLARDHQLVQDIAKAVVACGSRRVTCDPSGAHTNILLLSCDPDVVTSQQFCDRMQQVTEEEAAALGQRVVGRMLPFGEPNRGVRLVVHCSLAPGHIHAFIRKLTYVIHEFDRAGARS